MISAQSFPRIQWCALLICLTFAALLYGSWAWVSETRLLWDKVDAWVFFTLNGSLHHFPKTQLFWGIASTRLSDVISAGLMLGLFTHFVCTQPLPLAKERLAVFGLVIILLIVAGALTEELIEVKRASASLILAPVYRLSELISWLPVKDSSQQSFPGDHAMVLLIVTHTLWHFGGRKYGGIMSIIMLIFILPRLVAGAHWMTDVLVGSAFVSLVTVGLAIYTPVHHSIIQFFVRQIDRLPIITHLLQRVCSKG